MHNGLSCRSLYIPGSFNVKKYCNYPGSGSSIFHAIYVLNNQYYNHLRYPRIFRSTGLAKMHHINIARSQNESRRLQHFFSFVKSSGCLGASLSKIFFVKRSYTLV